MSDRVSSEPKDCDINIKINGLEFLNNFQNNFQFIQQLSEVIADSGDIGVMEYSCFEIDIKSLKTYENDLIICENNGWRRNNHK